MIELNTLAPNFTLYGQDEQLHTLSDYRGKYVVLYFYPRDLTAGCSLQAENYQASLREFEKINATIVGISRDTVKRHQKFCETKGLSFLLLADPDETVCEQFGVMQQKMMYGKQVRGIQRSTFIINPQGVCVNIARNVKAKLDTDATLTLLKQLQSQ